MKLTELLAGIGTEPVASSKAKADITGLSADSRKVKAGDLFIAMQGGKTDGANYAQEAVQRGAVAVLSEKPLPGLGAPVFTTSGTRKALALLAGNFYGNPARELRSEERRVGKEC